jgi:hypothetical protein
MLIIPRIQKVTWLIHLFMAMSVSVILFMAITRKVRGLSLQ